MAQRWLVAVLAAFLALTVSPLAGPALAQGQMPVWTVGDYWEYSGTVEEGGLSTNVTVRYEVLAITTLTVEETTYDVYKSKFTLSASSGGTSITTTGTEYRRTSDLGEVRTSVDTFGFSIVTTYSPPLRMEWPLEVGNSWHGNTTVISESDFGESRDEIEYSFEVVSSSTVTVPAGTFETYLIRQTGDGTSERHFAPAAGNFLRLSESGFGVLGEGIELKEFQYAGAGLFGSSTMILLLILLLIVVAVIAAVAVLMRRKRAPPVGAPMQPQPGQPMQPTYQPPPVPQQPPQQPPQGPGSMPPG